METILAGAFLGAGFAVCYLAWAWVIALVCKVPFKVVVRFWKDFS